MLAEALIVTAIASAMLGWNVHVMRKNGVSSSEKRERAASHRPPEARPRCCEDEQTSKRITICTYVKKFPTAFASTRTVPDFIAAQLTVTTVRAHEALLKTTVHPDTLALVVASSALWNPSSSTTAVGDASKACVYGVLIGRQSTLKFNQKKKLKC